MNRFFAFVAVGLASCRPRTILIGVDGLVASCLVATPSIKWLRDHGSWTLRARGNVEAISAPGWTSILCSLDPADTGIFSNVGQFFWDPAWKGPISPVDQRPRPVCLFEGVKTQRPGLRTAMFHDWVWLEGMGRRTGFVDESRRCEGDLLRCDLKNTVHAMKLIQKKDFDLMFLYFLSLDNLGHHQGFCSKEYNSHLYTIDLLIGKILESLDSAGILAETTVMLVSDHGATPGTNRHGELNDANLFAPLIVMGPGIKPNHRITANVHLTDVAPTIAAVLELEPHPDWRGKVISEIFHAPFKQHKFAI